MARYRDVLKFAGREQWPDGAVDTFEVPWPYERKPQIPARLHAGARIEQVPLDNLTATQHVVTDVGLRQYERGGGEAPLVYRMGQQTFIADGHHRMVAAFLRGEPSIRARVVDVPVDNPGTPAVWIESRMDRLIRRPIHKWRVAGESQIDGVMLREKARPDRYVICHRIPGGRWQATWFDAEGAGGDLRRDTLVEALNEQAHAGSYVLEELNLIADRTTRTARGNPAMANYPTKAIRMFRRFHTRDYRGDGELARSLVIPDRVICAGNAVNVMYASDKLNPETAEDEGWIDYIHEHSSGVHVYRCDRGAQGPEVAVPAWLRRIDQVTWLGDCLGFEYRDDNGATQRGHATKPLPELFCTTNGKALLVIQSKRTLVAMMWGGRLGVERRGIVH